MATLAVMALGGGQAKAVRFQAAQAIAGRDSFTGAPLGDGRGSSVCYAEAMSLLERLVLLIAAVLVVAALVLLIRHEIGRNSAAAPPASAADVWWR